MDSEWFNLQEQGENTTKITVTEVTIDREIQIVITLTGASISSLNFINREIVVLMNVTYL